MFFRFGSSNPVFYSHAPIIVQWKIVTNSKGSSHWRYTLEPWFGNSWVSQMKKRQDSSCQNLYFGSVIVFGFNGEIVEHTGISTLGTCPSLPKSSGHAFSAGVSLDPPLKAVPQEGFWVLLSHRSSQGIWKTNDEYDPNCHPPKK